MSLEEEGGGQVGESGFCMEILLGFCSAGVAASHKIHEQLQKSVDKESTDRRQRRPLSPISSAELLKCGAADYAKHNAEVFFPSPVLIFATKDSGNNNALVRSRKRPYWFLKILHVFSRKNTEGDNERRKGGNLATAA